MTTGPEPVAGNEGAASASRLPTARPSGSPLGAVRAFGVTLGGPLALAGGLVRSVRAAVRAVAAGRRVPAWALAGGAGVVGYVTLLRPRLLDWGATAEERVRPLPGDELVPDPASQTTRAVTVDASVDRVWPWLAQIGQDRGGFYSYSWLENLAGCRMRNADRVHEEWQHREVGETVPLHPATGLEVTRFDPGSVIALEGWGAFVVEPRPDGTTRLFARARRPRGLGPASIALLIELPHLVMERKMLLGIKQRAERAA
jgi:hypothetical protein